VNAPREAYLLFFARDWAILTMALLLVTVVLVLLGESFRHASWGPRLQRWLQPFERVSILVALGYLVYRFYLS
jgi:hypothetical protein